MFLKSRCLIKHLHLPKWLASLSRSLILGQFHSHWLGLATILISFQREAEIHFCFNSTCLYCHRAKLNYLQCHRHNLKCERVQTSPTAMVKIIGIGDTGLHFIEVSELNNAIYYRPTQPPPPPPPPPPLQVMPLPKFCLLVSLGPVDGAN